MDDPNGPWQDYGAGRRRPGGAPRHARGSWDPPGRPDPEPAWRDDPGDDTQPLYGGSPYPMQRLIAADYGYGEPRERPDGEAGGGFVESLRSGAAEIAWRYRSAPLWARITADIGAAALTLALIVGLSLALRRDDGPEPTGVREPIVVPAAPTTRATATSTTVPPTTTTVPPTTTTVPPTTVTTSPPIVPPPTEPAPPTTEEVFYRDCVEVWLAGAIPLREGDPGYRRQLDRDGDGEACEFGDGGGGGPGDRG